MSLFNGSIRPLSVLSDEAVERYLAAIRAELDPDPLFRRRLRGHVINRFVAAREGHRLPQRSVGREMGRLGRAVLIASFALGLSVTGVMAASERSIPGDVFYPLKLEIEELRVRALPAHLQADLAAYHLGQRIGELGRLAAAGEWGLVTAHAAAVERAYEAMRATGGEATVGGASLAIIHGLIEQLPDETRIAVEGVMSGMPGVGQEAAPGRSGQEPADGAPRGNPRGAKDGGSGQGPSTNAGDAKDGGSGGHPPDPASTNNGGNAAQPSRGGPDAADGSEGEEAEQAEQTEPTDDGSGSGSAKTPKPTKSPKPSASPSGDDQPDGDES